MIDSVRNACLIPFVLCACLLFIFSGCTTSPENTELPIPTLERSTPRPSSTTLPPPSQTASPTTKPDFLFSSVTILDDVDPNGFSVLGFFENQSDEAVTEVDIRATLHFSSEGALVWEEFHLPHHHALPFERVPFQIKFANQPVPKSVLLEVVGFQVSGREDAMLEVEITSRTVTSGGEQTLLGWITNPDDDPAQIHHFHLLTGSSPNEPTALLSSCFHPSSILPHHSVPFLFVLDEGQGRDFHSFLPFIDATVLPELTEPSLSVPQIPDIVFDPQGNLLVRGIIQNQDNISRWASAEIALLYRDQMVSLAPMKPPSPLGPGELRGFGLTDFPGWRGRLSELGGQPDELAIQVFYDPLGCDEFKGQIQHLAMEITGFESTGSTLLIKGSVSNPSTPSLFSPAIHAEIRTTSGVLQTSSWVLIDEIITEGQSMDFVLGIRLPAGIKLSEMEIDVTATAIHKDNVLPF